MSTLTISSSQSTASTLQPLLPPLREELDLYPGPPALDGSPTWILQDPAAHRYYRIGWTAFELLSRWHLRNPNLILRGVKAETVLTPSGQDLEDLIEFLGTHNLLQARGPQALERLEEHASRLARRDLMWWVKNYLFLRIPLVRPDRFLQATLPAVRWLGSRAFLWTSIIAAVLGLYLVQQQWQSFLSTFPHFFSLQGLVLMGIALTLAKITHELGHAYTARQFGCRVPSMGVALLVLWPVLYTDASDAWRLTGRRERLLIGSAGMLAELALAAWATLLWSFLPDGALRSAIFLLATTTWIATLLINLNPFMRFDGYYLLADYLGVPNLQERGFALARWRLREALFGLGETRPEQFDHRTHRILLVYAYGTWVYRFFLFLGIALLVYFLFFKALGIVLMLTELVWFIGRPVWNELRAWYERRHAMRLNGKTVRTLIIIAVLAGLLCFPWQREVSAPALWRAAEHARVYSPAPAQVTEILATAGTLVNAGQPLVRLHDPSLEHEIAQGAQRLTALNWQVESRGLHRELNARSRVLLQELETETSRQRARLDERERLTVRSPIPGVVREMQDPLRTGDWLPADQMLAVVVAEHSGRVEAWIAERDLNRIEEGVEGRFFPDDLSQPSFRVTVSALDTASTRVLEEPYLASTQNGPIAVRENSDGEPVPEQPVYRLIAEPQAQRIPQQVTRGTLLVQADRESLLQRMLRSAWAILIRESGF